MRRFLIGVLVTLLALGIAAIAVGIYQLGSSHRPPLNTALVMRGSLVPTLVLPASRRPPRLYPLVLPSGGKVTRIGVKAGDVVGVGTELLRVDGQPVVAMRALSPLRRTLQKGDVGLDVATLQMNLARLGYDAGPADGSFGPLTEAAVRRFQAGFGMRASGSLGPRQVQFLPLPLSVTRVAVAPAAKVAGEVGIDLARPGEVKDAPVVINGQFPWMEEGDVVAVDIPGQELSNVVKIPRAAVAVDGSGSHVTVVASGKRSNKRVTLGASSDSEIQVLRGLEPGARVLIPTVQEAHGSASADIFLFAGLVLLAVAGTFALWRRRGDRPMHASPFAAAATPPQSGHGGPSGGLRPHDPVPAQYAWGGPEVRSESPQVAWGTVLDRVAELPGGTSDLEEDLYALYKDYQRTSTDYGRLRVDAARVYTFSDELDGDESLAAVRSRLLEAIGRDGMRVWEPRVGERAPEGCEQVPARAEGVEAGIVLGVISPGLRAVDGEVVVPPVLRVSMEEGV